jgi:hypothetical protein
MHDLVNRFHKGPISLQTTVLKEGVSSRDLSGKIQKMERSGLVRVLSNPVEILSGKIQKV